MAITACYIKSVFHLQGLFSVKARLHYTTLNSPPLAAPLYKFSIQEFAWGKLVGRSEI